MKHALLCSLLALVGCDLLGMDDTVAVPLAQVRVDALPVRTWDPGEPAENSNPDIFIEVQLASGRSIYRSEIRQDIDPSLPLVVDVDGLVEVASPLFPMYISVYDADGSSLSQAQLMAKSNEFFVTDLQEQVLLTLSAVGGQPTRFTVAQSTIPEPAPVPTP